MLTKCKECGKEVSTSAISCPHCGYPISGQDTQVNIVKCPTCGSTDIEKISGMNKVASFWLVGPFALKKMLSTFNCKKCGCKW